MVQCNYEGFTKWKVVKAVSVRHLQVMFGNLSPEDFEGMSCAKMIPECDVTYDDFKCFFELIRKSFPYVIEKSDKWKPEHMTPEYVAVYNQMFRQTKT